MCHNFLEYHITTSQAIAILTFSVEEVFVESGAQVDPLNDVLAGVGVVVLSVGAEPGLPVSVGAVEQRESSGLGRSVKADGIAATVGSVLAAVGCVDGSGGSRGRGGIRGGGRGFGGALSGQSYAPLRFSSDLVPEIRTTENEEKRHMNVYASRSLTLGFTQ